MKRQRLREGSVSLLLSAGGTSSKAEGGGGGLKVVNGGRVGLRRRYDTPMTCLSCDAPRGMPIEFPDGDIERCFLSGGSP